MIFKDFTKKIENWDQKIIIKYNGVGGKPFTYILKIFSFFGRETLWIFLIAFYLFVWYDPFLLSHISGVFLTGLVLIVSIKEIVKRLRPFDTIENNKLNVLEKKPQSKSFPSWHAYNIVAYGLLIGLYFLKSPLTMVFMLGFAIMVSFSRIQLGVHYPSDVIFGCIMGFLGFILSIFVVSPIFLTIFEYFEKITSHTIEYRKLNSMLFKNIWYGSLWFLICCAIFLSAAFKYIKVGKRKG